MGVEKMGSVLNDLKYVIGEETLAKFAEATTAPMTAPYAKPIAGGGPGVMRTEPADETETPTGKSVIGDVEPEGGGDAELYGTEKTIGTIPATSLRSEADKKKPAPPKTEQKDRVETVKGTPPPKDEKPEGDAPAGKTPKPAPGGDAAHYGSEKDAPTPKSVTSKPGSEVPTAKHATGSEIDAKGKAPAGEPQHHPGGDPSLYKGEKPAPKPILDDIQQLEKLAEDAAKAPVVSKYKGHEIKVVPAERDLKNVLYIDGKPTGDAGFFSVQKAVEYGEKLIDEPKTETASTGKSTTATVDLSKEKAEEDEPAAAAPTPEPADPEAPSEPVPPKTEWEIYLTRDDASAVLDAATAAAKEKGGAEAKSFVCVKFKSDEATRNEVVEALKAKGFSVVGVEMEK